MIPSVSPSARGAAKCVATFSIARPHVPKLLHAIGPQRLHMLQRPHRCMHHRPLARHKLKVEPHRRKRQQQVRKDNRRIHTQPLGRCNRHLRRNLRRPADLQQRMVLPHGHILRHIPPSLPQKPHRRSVDRTTQASSHKPASTRHHIDRLHYRTFHDRIIQKACPLLTF